MVKWIIGALVGVVVMICAFLIIDPNASLVSTDKNSEISISTEVINIEIDGAVVNPGIYTLDSNSTLDDLINEAGGLLSSADETCFNKNLLILNYDLIYIPYEAGFQEECVPVTQTKININIATKEELSSINGISESIADKIIEFRETNGDFQSLEDIMLVSGIGTKTYEKIRDFISLK